MILITIYQHDVSNQYIDVNTMDSNTMDFNIIDFNMPLYINQMNGMYMMSFLIFHLQNQL